MTEQLLHGAQVGAAVEQVGGEGVAQGVGVGGRGRPAVEDAAHVAGREAAAPLVEEQRVAVGAPRRERRVAGPSEPRAQRVDGRLAERDGPLLAALAPHDRPAPVEVEVAGPEGAQLADPEAAAVEQLEHGVVAGPDARGRRRDRGAAGRRAAW